MTLLSGVEAKKSNDNIDKDKTMWNDVQQQSDEEVGQTSGANATKVLIDKVNPKLGSIIDKRQVY